MKFLLDANVEYRLARFLKSLSHDVKTIAHDYPEVVSDQQVLALAVEQKRILLTNDRDFGELIFRQHLPHCGVIYFRLKSSKDLAQKLKWIQTVLEQYKRNLQDFLVITPNGIRVRRSPETPVQKAA
jgi:predicted nuclease of predicted toxin-antitoxin system